MTLKGERKICVWIISKVSIVIVSLTHKREDPEVSCQDISKKDLLASKRTKESSSQVDFC